MAHIPSRLIRTRSQRAMDLKRGYTFLAGQHHVEHLKPCQQAHIGVFEDCSDQKREAVNRLMVLANPVIWAGLQRVDLFTSTARTRDGVLRPSTRKQIIFAGGL